MDGVQPSATKPVTWTPRVSVITLAVKDVQRSHAFYRKLGFPAFFEQAHIVFLDVGGQVIGLWDATEYRHEVGRPTSPSTGICLAHNVPGKGDVDGALAAAVAAGGKLLNPATDRDWGGRSGHVADPDGHVWEGAWNPHWPIAPDGRLRLQG